MHKVTHVKEENCQEKAISVFVLLTFVEDSEAQQQQQLTFDRLHGALMSLGG